MKFSHLKVFVFFLLWRTKDSEPTLKEITSRFSLVRMNITTACRLLDFCFYFLAFYCGPSYSRMSDDNFMNKRKKCIK